jgi:predicted nucleic acid-binding protein
VTAFVDTNVLVRHLTGDPPVQAKRATRYLERADELLLPDLILAEVAYVLESFYEVARAQVATTLRAILAFSPIRVLDAELLQRAIEIYEVHRLDFADAYLVASAERTGVGVIASFDRSIDRVGTVRREGADLTGVQGTVAARGIQRTRV